MSLLWTVGGAAVAALLLTLLLVEPTRRLAWRYGLIDRPDGHKAHRRPTPYLGGVAILVATLIPAGVAAHSGGQGLWAVVGCAIVAAALGLADDLGGLSLRVRLVVEVLLAVILVAGGSRLGLPGPGWLDLVVTVCWIVAMTNSFNLLDNADGALGTVACVSAVPIAALLFAGGRSQLGLLIACLAAACAGFLVHNAPPARIFMGDAGSLFIGLLLCAGATRVPVGDDRSAHLAVLLLLVFPAVVDTGLVVLSRLSHGSSLPEGTDHVVYRLRRMGFSAEAALSTLLFGGAFAGLAAVLVSGGLLSGRISLAVAAGAAAALIGLLMLLTPGSRRGSRRRRRAVTRVPGARPPAAMRPPPPATPGVARTDSRD